MKNDQTLLKNIEQELKDRTQNLKLEKKMSIAFQNKLDQQIRNKLHTLKKRKQENRAWILKIFEYYSLLLQNFMKKKSLIGLTVGLALIIAAAWLHLKPQKSKVAPSQTPELDSLLTNVDQNLNKADVAIKNLNAINESLDDEKDLSMVIDNLLKKAKTPPNDSSPAPKTTNIDISDLDALLGEINAAANAANNSISDFDSINGDEDKVSI